MKKKIKVLVVDDSAVVRQTMADILSTDPDIEVIATAKDPYNAASKMRKLAPDVITLDVEMPKMDGLTFLNKIMTQHPIPVVMISSLTGKDSEAAFKAMEYGAVDIITKPRLGTKEFLTESATQLCDVVKAASKAKLTTLSEIKKVAPKLTADAVIQAPLSKSIIRTTEKVVIVGASTGGTEALRIFLQNMPHDCPGIVIVQHMPEHFTKAFADRMNTTCRITVKEAEDDDTVIRGRALIAPGNLHTLLKRSGARYYVKVKEGPLVSRHRPSVDVLFRSAARYAGKNAVAVIMTGMGDDGAKGMLELKNSGAVTIAQDEKTCVVFGMPKKAIEYGAVDKILPLENLSGAIINECRD